LWFAVITPGALVPIKQELIRKAMEEVGPIRRVISRKSYVNSNAYNQGREDGSTVGIHRGVAGGSQLAGMIQ